MIKRAAERFFKWYCHPDYYEDIKGDLNELYQRQLKQGLTSKAERTFAIEVLMLFRPSIIRPFHWWDINNSLEMIQNYLKIGLRNLRKHPFYSMIHILGLALGLAAFLFIHHYRIFEKSYDDFHYQPNQLVRLTTDDVVNGKIQTRDAMSFAPSGKALQDELPEVIGYTTTVKTFRMIFKKEEQPVEETEIIAVDSSFLNLFRYEILEGDKKTMLLEPNTIVLTESMAKKYFGDAKPVGQTIEVLGAFNRPFRVTGLMADIPKNTHYSFNALVSLKTFQQRIENDGWNGYNYYTYLLLNEQTSLSELQSKMPALSRKLMGEDNRLEFNLQPVRDIHLYSDFTFEPQIHGSAKAVSFLGIISLFILLIAWVNYINLSTARAMERAKEVGLRKIVGAQKRQLISQFLTEAVIINFLGAALALSIVYFLLPYFHSLIGKTIIPNLWTHTDFLKNLGLFFLIGTLITGIYPAILLSSFRPIGVLKGNFGRSKNGTLLRKSLVIIQFTASLVLIAATTIVYQQIRFMTNKDLGINTDQVIGFQNPASNRDELFVSQYQSFTEELQKLSGVKSVAGISNLPGGGSSDISSSSGGIKIIGKTDRVETTVYINSMTDQMKDALQLELTHGRNFDREIAGDSNAIIVNESLLSMLNIQDPSTVVNEFIQFGRDPDNDRFQIVGILKDYNRSTLKSKIEPTVFFHREVPRNTLVKLNSENMTSSIASVQSTWNKFFPDSPFAYSFLDQRFEKLYMEDRRFGLIFFNFSLLAIFVASIGLFGLSSYLAIQRTKEVGVRKVLGASVNNIVLLFFRDFLWLILIAILIGIPLIYLGMNDWLNTYAYRINFPWGVLILAIIAIIFIAFVTVSYQTWKLARLNPAKTVRYE